MEVLEAGIALAGASLLENLDALEAAVAQVLIAHKHRSLLVQRSNLSTAPPQVEALLLKRSCASGLLL